MLPGDRLAEVPVLDQVILEGIYRSFQVSFIPGNPKLALHVSHSSFRNSWTGISK
jgi:hypothetical protein